MTETFTTVEIEELKHLVVTCPAKNCGTSIEFDATENPAPFKCPTCGQEFGSVENGLRDAIAGYKKFFREMNGFGLKPRFRIRVETPKT